MTVESREAMQYIICCFNIVFLLQVHDVIRGNYDTLTLKLQENLDNYEKYVEKPKESSFFTQLVSVTSECMFEHVATSHIIISSVL